jgi:hypothetical protein
MSQLASNVIEFAPHANRSVLLAPNFRVNLAAAGHPLANHIPRTKLGGVALDFVMATHASLISVAATTAYVYAIINLVLPILTFRDPPPGTTISPKDLQNSYDDFNTQLAILQGQAAAWVDTQPGTSSPSIFSQLVAIPSTFSTINGSVQSKFAILSALTPGSSDYNNTMLQLRNLIGAENPDITNLVSSMQTLGTNLQDATDALDTAANTGVLAQLISAYQSEISALIQAIDDANATIASDNSQIVGLGFAAGASIVIGLIGLANFWNPVGWLMIGGGAVGAYFAIAEIYKLRGDIARQNVTIQNDEAWETDDTTAAASVQSVIDQIKGFASMNSAAQEELTALENLLNTLYDDIATALNDLEQNDLTDALDEWNEIVSAASVLSDVTAYVWPTPIMLPQPTTFAAAGSDIYTVGVSGQANHYANANGAWSSVSDMSLSIVAAGLTVAGINGAPADGANVSPTPYTTDYHVKLYNDSTNTWTTISTFPAAQIAMDSTSIYAINQLQDDRQVYKYSGSGTSWSALPAMPDNDAPQQLAVSGGMLFAITTNSMQAYYYDGAQWNSLGSATYVALASNENMVGFVDTNNHSFLYNASSASFANDGNMTCSSVAQIAQVSNGDQYVINTDQQLCYIDNQTSSPASSVLKSNIVNVVVSDTDLVYCSDNEGNSYKLSDLAKNQWTQLPAISTN